jgi:phosphoglucomutase
MQKVTCAIPAERIKLAIDYDRNLVVTRESILYNPTKYLRASTYGGTIFATRRSNAPSTSPVVGVFL